MNAALQSTLAELEQRESDRLFRVAELQNRHCDNERALSDTLNELAALSAELAAVKARKALLLTFAELVQATPVSSGHARAGWTLSTSGEHSVPPLHADSTDAGQVDARVDAAIAETLNNLPDDVFATLSLGNAVPYLAQLEAGLSAQAPAGFVSRAMENFRARLTQATGTF